MVENVTSSYILVCMCGCVCVLFVCFTKDMKYDAANEEQGGNHLITDMCVLAKQMHTLSKVVFQNANLITSQ